MTDTSPVPVTALYFAAHAVLLVLLTLNVVRLRRKLKIGIGDGGERSLRRAIRVHGNFIEFVPTALLGLALLELQGMIAPVLHGLGGGLLIGRLGHAQGMGRSAGVSPGRFWGVAATLIVLCVEAALLVWTAAL